MAFRPVPNPKLRTVSADRRRRQGGTALVEFVLSTALLIVPIFFGIITVGLSLILANQVTEVCRGVGHMFAYGVNFSQSSSQLLVTNQLAQGLNMTPTGGRGVIYLSVISKFDSSSCTSAGLDTSHCKNVGLPVVIKRLTIGNTGMHASSFAPNITPSIIDSGSGNITLAKYLSDTSVQATSFDSVIPLAVGGKAFVAEMFVNPPTTGLWALFSSNIITARSIF